MNAYESEINMINFKGNPFFLDEEAIQWIETTYKSMSLEEKIGQLFCPIVFTGNPDELKKIVQEKHIGGVLYREGKGADIQTNHRHLQDFAKIPLLIAANLESGGNGTAEEGTYYGKEMLVAATNDVSHAYRLGKVSGLEGAAVGVNWSFAPVVDIDCNFRNPITNVRTFGSDVTTVKEYGKAYMKGCMEAGVATSVKHFPGDGIDERDQHLLTSVNTLSKEEWDATFGSVYKELIQEGTLTIMAGHIALPSYEDVDSDEGVKVQKMQGVIPATLSKNLLQNLLRGKLAFNGLITTDATPMVGFCAAMDRRTAVPMSIEVGCDMFLFNKDLDEDIAYMTEGYHNKILSDARLEEAVKRILATKAAIELHKKQEKGLLVPESSALDILGCEEHRQWASECAEQGITLVKDTQKILPITVTKHRRILLEMMGDYPSNERVYQHISQLLIQEGYEVTRYVPEDFSKPLDTVEVFKEKYDLVIYLGNIETSSNKTVARLNWFTLFGLGNNMPWFVKEVPTIFISLGNPYHLFDAPMIPCYINGYCNSTYVLDAVINKIIGRNEFFGKSPVDAFCNRWDTHF